MKKSIKYVVFSLFLFMMFNLKAFAYFKDVDYSTNSNYKMLCKYDLVYDKNYTVMIFEKTSENGIFAVSYIEGTDEKGLEGTTSEINNTGNFSNTKSMVNVKAMGCPTGAFLDKSAIGWDEICFSNYYGKTKTSNRVTANCLVNKNIGTNYEDNFVSSTLSVDNSGVSSSGGGNSNSDVDIGDFTTSEDCYGFLGDKNSSGTPAYYLHFALITMRYLAIILALVLSTVDFFKAIYSQDKDLLKKASLTSVKRLVFAVIMFFIPTVLEFILGILGAYTVQCV